ncbi:MAG TPA: hypothetical protein ENH60_04230 [Pricia sp.]|nr:hypothetical protein [Pricia sp.]
MQTHGLTLYCHYCADDIVIVRIRGCNLKGVSLIYTQAYGRTIESAIDNFIKKINDKVLDSLDTFSEIEVGNLT